MGNIGFRGIEPLPPVRSTSTRQKVAIDPLHIKLPDGSTIKSSHTANIALPQLPPMARLAHVVPGLASHSLVSVVKLCNAGCRVVINDIACEIYYRGKPVIQCSKCIQTGLWMIPLVPDTEQGESKPNGPQDGASHQAHHVHQSSTKAETAQFYHQSLFSPPAVTLLKAVNNDQLNSFPGLVPALLKHLSPSTVTAKRHMHKNRKGLRSTTSTKQDIADARLDVADMNPPPTNVQCT